MTSESQVPLESVEKVGFKGIVRFLREDDLPSVKPILEMWVRKRETGELLPEEVEKDLQMMRDSLAGVNQRIYFVAEEDGTVVGIIGMLPPSDEMKKFVTTENPIELVNAYVAKDKRAGKGVGRAYLSMNLKIGTIKGNPHIYNFTSVLSLQTQEKRELSLREMS